MHPADGSSEVALRSTSVFHTLSLIRSIGKERREGVTVFIIFVFQLGLSAFCSTGLFRGIIIVSPCSTDLCGLLGSLPGVNGLLVISPFLLKVLEISPVVLLSSIVL